MGTTCATICPPGMNVTDTMLRGALFSYRCHMYEARLFALADTTCATICPPGMNVTDTMLRGSLFSYRCQMYEARYRDIASASHICACATDIQRSSFVPTPHWTSKA